MTKDKARTRFILCVRNQGANDLEPRKVYQLLPDRVALRDGYLRVIDESGEDYLYPVDYFVPVTVPVASARMLASTTSESPPTPKGRKRRPA
jgi:hypothetical protein